VFRGSTFGIAIAFTLLGGWTAWPQSGRSVWDGVYTEPQATRGQAVFDGICSRCHNVSDFTGDTFLTSWEASTALDLFAVMQKSMPQDSPGSLEAQQYADVLAYMFRSNQFPAGMGELATDAEQLKLIRIERKK
jgi:mono/diheme cytochrome c family protein